MDEQPTTNTEFESKVEEGENKESEITTEEKTGEQVENKNSEMDKQIKSALKQIGVPENQEYFIDDNGQLKFVVKIDGEKYGLTFDELQRNTNITAAAHKNLSEAKKEKKAIEAFFDKIEKNPDYLFEAAAKIKGVDKYQLAQMLLEQKIEELKMTPEQRMLNERARRAKELEEENSTLKQREESRRVEELKAKEYQQAQYDLVSAMRKNGMDGKSAEEKKNIASLAINYYKIASDKQEPISWEDAVYAGKQAYKQLITTALSSLSETSIGEYLTEEQIDRLLKYKRSVLKKQDDIPTSNAIFEGARLDLDKAKLPDQTSNKPRQRIRASEFFAKL